MKGPRNNELQSDRALFASAQMPTTLRPTVAVDLLLKELVVPGWCTE